MQELGTQRETFLLVLAWSKVKKFKTRLRVERSLPCPFTIQFLASKDQSDRKYTFSNAPLFPQGTKSEEFWPFYIRIYTIYTAFFLSKKLQKYENMMSCTRLYVDYTDTLMCQARKMRLLSNLNQ